jgi:hypothetical protein
MTSTPCSTKSVAWDDVDCLLAEPALRELPVQAADLEPVGGLQPHHSQPWSDVVVDAHAVIANGVGTDVATSCEPLLKVSPRVSRLRSTYVPSTTDACSRFIASTASAFDLKPPPRRCCRGAPTAARSILNHQLKERPPHFPHLIAFVATRHRQPACCIARLEWLPVGRRN